MANHFRTTIASLLSLLLCGCGYHLAGTPDTDPLYHNKTLYRDDVSTVAVPIFANRTYYQGLEFRLTKAIINQMEGQTPYKVVPKERADTILEGEIINVHTLTQSNNRITAVPQEQLYSVVIRFSWRDLRTGKILASRKTFEQTASYYASLGEDQIVGEQLNIERMALALVQALEADWGVTKAPPD